MNQPVKKCRLTPIPPIPPKVGGDAGLEADTGYTGHFYHAASGLSLAPYRAYDAGLGRWLSRDPIGEEGGINLYGYCLGNPVGNIDPDGLDVTAVFDRGSGTLTVTDNQTGATASASPVFSGNGANANNPAAQGIVGSGPLPGGQYLVGDAYNAAGHSGDNQWYKLYGDNGKGGYSYNGIPVKDAAGNIVNRGGFNLHTGRASDGCVTVWSDVDNTDPKYPTSKQFDQIKKLLDSTTPLNYKGSTYRGTLIVK